MIWRGGLPLRIPCLAVLLLCGCASLTTTALKPTDTIRNTAITEKSATIHFLPGQNPSTTDPNLKISIARHVTNEETFQRRFIEKQVLKPGTRAALWIRGAAIAGCGYYIMTETG